MANELEITGILRYRKDGVKAELALNSRVNVANDKITEVVQNIPSTGTGQLLEIGSISTLGYAIIQNLDETNSVNIRAVDDNAATDLIKIPAGKFAGPFQFNINDPRAIASGTGGAKIRMLLIEQ